MWGESTHFPGRNDPDSYEAGATWNAPEEQ